jgi:hypothetical protein
MHSLHDTRFPTNGNLRDEVFELSKIGSGAAFGRVNSGIAVSRTC